MPVGRATGGVADGWLWTRMTAAAFRARAARRALAGMETFVEDARMTSSTPRRWCFRIEGRKIPNADALVVEERISSRAGPRRRPAVWTRRAWRR